METDPEAVAGAVERQLWGEPSLTARDLAERAGTPLEFLIQSRRALGVSAADPGEVAFDEHDLASAERLRVLLDAGVPSESLLAVMRVLGVGMGRYAEAVRDLWIEAFAGDGDDPEEAATRMAAMAERFLPLGAEMLGYVFSVHLRELLRHDVAGLTGRAPQGGRLVAVAIGFADIVGFTELGEQMPGDELGAIADRLTSRAHEICAAPVRLVKTIGDAVMLAAPEPAPLLEALLELVEPEEGAPAVRAGLAYGEALHRMGDYYGHTVNVASRVAQRARPGSVLATEAVRDAVPERFGWSATGPKRLKGVGNVTLHRARPPK